MRKWNKYFSGIILLSLSFIGVRFFFYSAQISINIIPGILAINILILLAASELTDLYKYKYLNISYTYALTPVVKTFILHLIVIDVISASDKRYGQYSMYMQVSVVVFYLVATISILLKTLRLRIKRIDDIQLNQIPPYPDTECTNYTMDEFQQTKRISLETLLEGHTLEDKRIANILFINSQIENITGKDGLIFPVLGTEFIGLKIYPETFNELKNINDILALIHKELLPMGFLIIRYVSKDESYYEGQVISKGKEISKAEMWGRLHYSGFEVLHEINNNDCSYILAQKKKKLFIPSNASYYPLIKLKRVGYLGVIINIYKLRSMYPYSEFIQEKVYKLNKLDNSGKISRDFRITKPGRFLRKYWIDEIPQIINWLKSDIKLVGIRAMSIHYFNLYPDYYKINYCRVKPGLIPPLFDDREKEYSEIISAEFSYLESYLMSPFKTDLKYFISAFSGIFIKGIRGK